MILSDFSNIKFERGCSKYGVYDKLIYLKVYYFVFSVMFSISGTLGIICAILLLKGLDAI